MVRKVRIFTGLLVLLLAALPASAWAAVPAPTLTPASGQTAGTAVTYDTPVTGSIDDQTPSQNWTLTAQGADRISIKVERSDGNLIPDVTLLDNNSQTVTQSNGADETKAVALINDYTLAQANTYTVQVSRENGATGKTSGKYTLTVITLGLGADNPANTVVVGPVQYGTPVTGEIIPSHWNFAYELDGQAGDNISITAQRTSGTLVSEIELFDNNGQSLSRGFKGSLDDNSTLNSFSLTYAGKYTVAVRRENGISGDTTGGFQLTVTLLGSGEDSDRLKSATPGVIAQYNAPVQGTITGANWYQDWQFKTLAADVVTISVQRSPDYTQQAPNLLRPTVALLDNTGQDLNRGYPDNTGAATSIERFDLPAAGTYTIRVGREGDKGGVTTGSYQLTVTLVGSGKDSPSLQDQPQPVTAGTPVTGQIDPVKWQQTWTFSATKDQQVSFTVTRTGGTLIPYLEIQDSNGVQQNTGYAGETADTATIENFNPQYTGDYKIVVSRDKEQDGLTTGAYSLAVTASGK